jgi:hypothetical protein
MPKGISFWIDRTQRSGELRMGPDFEIQEIIGKALMQTNVQIPGSDVGRSGNIDDIARIIMDALADAGFKIVKK